MSFSRPWQIVISLYLFHFFQVTPVLAEQLTLSDQFPDSTIAEMPTLNQVTSVDQLTDVQPTDWAFQALQSLIERHRCITGYSDSTFRGSRALTRYEFTDILNSCLNRLNELMATKLADQLTQEDLFIVQKLQEEFAEELTTLRVRIDTLEARTTQLEANQFSTTTKLSGQVIFAVNGGAFEGDGAGRPLRDAPLGAAKGDRIVSPTGAEIALNDPNIASLYRVVLDLDTSFHGSDRLKIRLETGSNGSRDNAAGVLEPFFGSVLDFSVKPPSDGNIGVGRLYYTFHPIQDFTVSFGSNIRTTDYVDRNSHANLNFRDFATQAFINNFILLPINGPSTGAALDWKPKATPFRIRAVYAAADAQNPRNQGQIRGLSTFIPLLYSNNAGDRGLFGDTYQGIVEFEYAPDKAFALRLQYTGGQMLSNRFDVFGVNFELALSDKLAVFGRYGYGDYSNTTFGDLNPQYWMAGVAFRDLLKPGAIAGIAAGQPFIEGNIGNATQTNFEAFYNLPINDRIRVTPLIQVITNAANQNTNGTIMTGTLRTVFSF
ncbi:iron uptake porin [Hassallia byssoidea VB512170]|uniref:Iron uptake porin n=1 Tax=Hassallia byssoidea VB512170 TaxID=1304833 RepID=A0A846HEH2_9CYAN|nr:iron uptake porin [Hassalia byssoidea]NEU75054.1 iron uptake porin [Hassalia byssoidea VB512170]